MRYFLLIAVLLTVGSALFGQNSNLVIQGRVMDAEAQAPIPYANVILLGELSGSITNEAGVFRLLYNGDGTDTLRISHLGYATLFLPLSQLVDGRDILLKPSEQRISDVVITGLSARNILQKAIDRIPENHAGLAYESGGFYRLSTRKGEQYIHLSECAFDIFHPADLSEEKQFRVDRMRVMKDERVAAELNWGMRPKQLMAFDLLTGGGDWELLKKQGLKKHKFSLEEPMEIDGREVHVLAFDQLDGLKYAGYRGKLYIDAESYAFYRIETSLSPKGLPFKKYGNAVERTILSALGIDLTLKREQYQVNYRRVDDKYLFSDAKNLVWLDLKSTRSGFDFLAESQVDYVTTAFKLEGVEPFPEEDVMGKNKFLEWQEAGFDSTFWKDHTTILPDADFDSIAAAIDSSNVANDHRLKVRSKIYRVKKDPVARLDTILNYYHAKGLFCGNALVEHEGEVIFERSFNNEFTNNRKETAFRIGSTAKTFTAVLVMQLAEEGKLDLSDSLGRYLRWYAHGEVTLAQLLSHTSGIPDYMRGGEHLEALLGERMELERIAKEMCSAPLEFRPGEKFSYSNSGFLLLALVVEQVEGKAFGEVLRERIFTPLEMESSFHGEVGERTNVARGWMYGQEEPSYPIGNVSGAGAISSTAGDLLKWSRAMDEEQLLSVGAREEMWHPRAEYKDWDADYAYGWMIDRHAFEVSGKRKIVYHPGTDFGFHSMFLKVPATKTTIILLSNTGEFPRFDMADLILEALD